MKKLVVFMVAIAMVVIALPVMAQSKVTLTGNLTYGAVFGTTVVNGFGDSKIDLAAQVDANNSFYAELWGNGLATSKVSVNGVTATDSWGVGALYLKSDIGGVFGLGSMVDPVLYAGLGAATMPGYGVTGYGFENIAGLGLGGEGAGLNASETTVMPYMALNIGIASMVNLLVGVNPLSFTSGNATQAVVGAYGTVGPVQAEVGLVGNGAAGLTNGDLAAGALFDYTVSSIELKVTGQIVAGLASGANTTYSAGLSANFMSLATLAGSIVGATTPTSGLTKGTIELDLTPFTFGGINAATAMNFASGAPSLFDTWDISAYVNLGKALFRVGYITGQTGAGSLGTPAWNAPAGGTNGLYLRAGLAF